MFHLEKGLTLCLCCIGYVFEPDWGTMLTAATFPEISVPHEHSSVRTLKRTTPSNPVAMPYVVPPVLQGTPSTVHPSMRTLKSRSSSAKIQLPPLVAAPPGPAPTPQQLDTELARKGSNFGLPIALQLTRVMGGAVGIVSVRATTEHGA